MEELHKAQQQLRELKEKLKDKISEGSVEEEGCEEWKTRAAKAKRERDSPYGKSTGSEDKDKAK